VLIVTGFLLAVVAHQLGSLYHGNPTGFVLFGHYFASSIHPPRGAIEDSPFGYDGQFFYLLARDPLLLHHTTLAAFRHPAGEAFRIQRVAYPLLSYVVALGQRGALPWAMVVLNVLVVAGVTLGFSYYCQARGWSAWWGLALGLLTGFVVGTLRDLSDPLAVASTLGGVLLWRQGRRWSAGLLLALAVLAREPMLLAVVAVAVDGVIDAWRTAERGPWLRAARRVVIERGPVVLIPVVAYLCWKLYATARLGASISSPSSAYLPPFVGVIDEVKHSLADPHRSDVGWELLYLAAMMAGIGLAGRLLWRARRGSVMVPLAAVLFGLSLLVVVFGDPWSYSRLSAPMFAVLLLGALELRDRPALLLCSAVALLGLVAPLAPWMAAG
jgi:hypothetical protein